MDIITKIRNLIFENKELEYRDFSYKLNPGIDNDSYIGVRIPILRSISKIVEKESDIDIFLNNLPHKYFEEYLVHRFILENMKDYDKALILLNKLLPYFNSWSLTDGFKNKSFLKRKNDYIFEIYKWIDSDNTFISRFGIGQLMNYLKDDFEIEYLEKVISKSANDDYYLEMMISWFLQVSFTYHFNETYDIFKNAKLNKFIINKTISKCNDSYRISEHEKEILKDLRRK